MLFAAISAGVMAAVACASSENETSIPGPDAAPQPTPPSDGGTTTGDSSIPIRDTSTCSAAGWCITVLPDSGLILKDIWPFERRAFAIAESYTLGIKVLEWDASSDAWKYIDDNTQNEYGIGKFAGKIWAASENEIYYSIDPGLVYHGERVAPSAPWSWERDLLADNSRDRNPAHDHGLAYADPNPDTSGAQRKPATFQALGVWGTSSGDVYAWYANTIFHRKSEDGGAPAWVTEYVLADPDAPEDATYVFSAAGTGPDDVWFAGGRVRYDGTAGFERNASCPVLIRKTANGYQRIVDAVINAGYCEYKAGTSGFYEGEYLPEPYPEFGLEAGLYTIPSMERAWMTNIASAGAGSVVGVMNGDSFAYVVASNDGGLARRNRVKQLAVPSDSVVPWTLNSVWFNAGAAWVSGWGLVLRIGDSPAGWSTGLGISNSPAGTYLDAGTYSVSTTVINGVPLDAALYQIRGTSNSNLWAIGAQYALHKTTP